MAYSKNEFGLNPRQERYCREFVVDNNQTNAAMRAGYAIKSAQSDSSKLMKNPLIKARIAQLRTEIEEKTEITAKMVLRELARIAFLDVSKAFDENGILLPLHDLPVDIRHAVSEYSITPYFVGSGPNKVKIGEGASLKFRSKERPLELLGKHLGLFSDKMEHRLGATLEELITGIPREAK